MVDKKKDNPELLELDRRNLMKLGVGAGVAMAGMLAVAAAFGQQGPQAAAPIPPTGPLGNVNNERLQHWPDIRESMEISSSAQPGYMTETGPGWVNDSGRASGNGPMDECTRRIVEFVDSYSYSKMTDPLIETARLTTLDTLACIVSGFEEEPARVNARLSLTMPGPCTMMGYGIKTTYEMAAFANGCLIRHTDFNPGAHNTEMYGGIFAVGEALHSSGPDIMTAMAIAYEVVTAIGNTGKGNYDPGGYDCPYHSAGVAMAVGKLMGLNQDQLANALSLALVPHFPLYVCHIGTQSMWKGCHSSEQVRNGVWGAMLARAGMTGPCQPFEAREGIISHIGPFTRDLKLPTSADGRMALETIMGNGRGYKRFASEGTTQTLHGQIIPPLHAWAKPEEIESIKMDNNYYSWQEICDPPKWDPRNRETADHSMPYNIARGIIDGYIYLDSFTPEKVADPQVKELMNKITIRPTLSGPVSLKVRKKSGEERVFAAGQGVAGPPATMTEADLNDKFNRVCDYKKVKTAQRDQARKEWMDIRNVKDIGGPIATFAKFGEPKPL